MGGTEGVELHPQLKSLVEYIWAEATGELEEVGVASGKCLGVKYFCFVLGSVCPSREHQTGTGGQSRGRTAIAKVTA